LHVGATAVFQLFAIVPVDNLTAPLWRCLDFSKNKLNATSQVWEFVSHNFFYTKVRTISKFRYRTRDNLIRTSHTIAPTCNRLRGENAFRVLIW